MAYYINLSVRTREAVLLRDAVTELFTAHGFVLLGEESAAQVVEDEETLPEGDNWYGVVVSGKSGAGWVTVYVDDWQDSGVLAHALSQKLAAPTLEIWVADDVHWGYTYYENGDVVDRYADDPAAVAETNEEKTLYRGHANTLSAVLTVSADQLQSTLDTAHGAAGEFAGPGIDALAQAVGLPFEHVFTGYEFFFEDDPDDYGPSLERWSAFRHLAFQPPPGRDTLAE